MRSARVVRKRREKKKAKNKKKPSAKTIRKPGKAKQFNFRSKKCSTTTQNGNKYFIIMIRSNKILCGQFLAVPKKMIIIKYPQ